MGNGYPKVLVIGNTFHTKSGGGITMTNLFSGWPKGKLAVAASNIHLSEAGICETYYQIGDKEDNLPWIFQKIKRQKVSGPIKISENCDSSVLNLKRKEKNIFLIIYQKINHIAGNILRYLGLYHLIYKMKVSEEFVQWIKEINPDVLYVQITKYIQIRFMNDLVKRINIPFAIHFMDDHISFISEDRGLGRFWKKKIIRDFYTMINRAYVLMSICDSMSSEYERRYRKKFIAFHNPINIGIWGSFSKTDWHFDGAFKILYAGRIGIGTYESLLEIASAVDELNREGLNIQFDIQTNSNIDESFKGFIKKYSHTKITNSIPYKLLPKRFSEADLLALPIDFNDKGYKYLKYSMPTKTSEYMITGTPILVYSPDETALVKYAKEYDWGYTVVEQNKKELKYAIKNLYSKSHLREKLGRNGIITAEKNHDSTKICKKFQNTLSLT